MVLTKPGTDSRKIFPIIAQYQNILSQDSDDIIGDIEAMMKNAQEIDHTIPAAPPSPPHPRRNIPLSPKASLMGDIDRCLKYINESNLPLSLALSRFYSKKFE